MELREKEKFLRERGWKQEMGRKDVWCWWKPAWGKVYYTLSHAYDIAVAERGHPARAAGGEPRGG